MEGPQTMNKDNGVLQPQAKDSESGTGTPGLFDSQVRFPPPRPRPPDHMQEKPSF